jgi:hypothetical protein
MPRSKAFHFSALPPSDIRGNKYLGSSDPMDVLNSVLANVMVGDFTHFSKLIDLMKQFDDGAVWGCCADLYAYAAPYSALHDLIDAFQSVLFRGDDIVTQGWISETLCESGALWGVPHVLAIFRLNQSRDKYFATPTYLSRMLEEEREEIANGPPVLPRTDDLPEWFDVPPVYDDRTFEQQVMERHAALSAQVADPNRAAVWEGRPLSLVYVAEKTLARILEGEDTDDITRGRLLLEATTGQDLSDWYVDSLLANLTAAAGAETLLESATLRAFEPGVRYFFGRRIPD